MRKKKAEGQIFRRTLCLMYFREELKTFKGWYLFISPQYWTHREGVAFCPCEQNVVQSHGGLHWLLWSIEPIPHFIPKTQLTPLPQHSCDFLYTVYEPRPWDWSLNRNWDSSGDLWQPLSLTCLPDGYPKGLNVWHGMNEEKDLRHVWVSKSPYVDLAWDEESGELF